MGVFTGTSPTDPTVGSKTSATAFGVPAADAIQALASATTAYTPTLSGTGWALGSGTLTGSYTQVGKFVVFRISCAFGAGMTAGAGAMALSLPVTSTGAAQHAVSHSTLDTSASARYHGVALVNSTTCSPYYTPAAAGGADRTATTSVPFTWASGDSVVISGWYEAA